MPEVDLPYGDLGSGNRCAFNCFRSPENCGDHAVVVVVPGVVREGCTGGAADCVSYGFNDIRPSAFAEIDRTLDDLAPQRTRSHLINTLARPPARHSRMSLA